MTLELLKAVGMAAGLALAATAGQAAVVYTDAATDFNGNYRGVETLDVAFSATAGSGSIAFDLFGARSVDGDNDWSDVFTIALNGITVFAGTFSLSGGGNNVVSLNTLGWQVNTVTNPGGAFAGGVASVSGLAAFLGGANLFSVSFTSPGPNNGGAQGSGDESWALNNLDVTPAPVPVPAALPLLGLGLAGLGAVGLRRRKTL